jgi:hypothetical protein
MPKIYRKVILGYKTNFFKCSDCLDKDNLPKIDWVSRYVEDIVPGDGNPGVWEEAPLETCDYCYAVDADSREEMYEWSAEMDRQQWEEEQFPADYNPQEYK